MRQWVMGLLVTGLALAAWGGEAEIPETTDGLKAQMAAVFEAAKAGDNEKLTQRLKQMILPDAEAWFKELLGEEPGAVAAKEYANRVKDIVPHYDGLFKKLVAKQPVEIIVAKLRNPDDMEFRGRHDDAHRQKKKYVALYHVLFRGDKFGWGMPSFVYVKGAFRVVMGKAHVAAKD